MRFNTHSDLTGRHAYLSASNPAWMNYAEAKFDRVFLTNRAARTGVERHAFAAEAIRLGILLQDIPETLNMYVNDAIRFRMQSEQILYYSDNAFGTADAIAFRDDFLRIHDYKSGVTPTDMRQLFGYAALFCLEYRVNPFNIETELRIYQNNDIKKVNPDPGDILFVMEKYRTGDRRIRQILKEELL